MSTVAEFIARRNEEDLRSVLKEPWGQRFVSQLLYDCGIYETGIDFDNIRKSDFNAGRRSIGLALQAKVLELNPEAMRNIRKHDQEDAHARRTEMEQQLEASQTR